MFWSSPERAEMKEIAGKKYVSWQHHKRSAPRQKRGGNFRECDGVCALQSIKYCAPIITHHHREQGLSLSSKVINVLIKLCKNCCYVYVWAEHRMHLLSLIAAWQRADERGCHRWSARLFWPERNPVCATRKKQRPRLLFRVAVARCMIPFAYNLSLAKVGMSCARQISAPEHNFSILFFG